MSEINCLYYPSPNSPAEILLIMLPGAGIVAADFAAQGMIDAVQARGLGVDIIVAEPNIALYLDDGVTGTLHRAVVEPALARGITRIWLLGISLGGMGALLYASAHAALLEGVFLLAPFLGTKGTTAELTRAGGLPAWQAAISAATPPEQRLLTWLQTPAALPLLYLGYATGDRFAAAHQLLAAIMPPARVAVASGGHDWISWAALWYDLLDRAPFKEKKDVLF
jgi:hypothetical protein